MLTEKIENSRDFKSLDHWTSCGSLDSSASPEVSTAEMEDGGGGIRVVWC